MDTYDRFCLFADGVQALLRMSPDDPGYGYIKATLARDCDGLLDALDKVLWAAKVRRRRQ